MYGSSPTRSPSRRATSPTKRYYETNAEADHKDLILSQLKAELFDLRKNQRDYNDLHTRLTNLEHRYNLLQEEKTLNEVDFKTRYETNLKNIANLKDQIEFARRDANDISASNANLRVENKNITDIIESRTNEINRLDLQIDDIDAQNGRLDLDKKDLTINLRNVKDENADLAKRIGDMQRTQDDYTVRKIRNEKAIKDLEENIARLDRTQISLNKDHDNLRVDLYNKNDAIRLAEAKLTDNKKIIIRIEGDIADMKRLNERLKNEIATHTTNYQNQSNVNADCQVRSQRLDETIGARDNEIDDLRSQLEALKQKHLNLVNANEDLNHDIEAATKHLEELTLHNHELVAELEKYHEQDQKARAILDRKDKVEEVKVKTEQRMKSSASKMSASLRSPKKSRPAQE